MKKIVQLLFLVSLTANCFAASEIDSAGQLKIIQEQTTALNKCSGLAMINPEGILASKDNLDACKIPNYVFSQLNIFSNDVISKDELLQLKSASAVAKGIVIRNQNDRGLPVDSHERNRYYNAPYDVLTTKQMPKVACAYLSALYEKKPQYFEKKPSCIEVINVLNK